jgi:hypothetical protein
MKTADRIKSNVLKGYSPSFGFDKSESDAIYQEEKNQLLNDEMTNEEFITRWYKTSTIERLKDYTKNKKNIKEALLINDSCIQDELFTILKK